MVKILFFWKANTLKPLEAISGIIKHYIVLMFNLVWVFVTLWTVATILLLSWEFSCKNTGMVCYFLLQGVFQTQGLKLCLLHCRWILYPMSYQESPQTLNKKWKSQANFDQAQKNLGNLITTMIWNIMGLEEWNKK